MSGDSIASPTFCPKDSGTIVNENKKAISSLICQQLSILHLTTYFIEFIITNSMAARTMKQLKG
tara:strand:+ start:1301 stop:1492 length:192 start_codon:yes stop_codon:yes gene_type:complete